MSLKETTAQKKIARLKKRVRVVQGGTSSSKTYSILPLLFDYASHNPGIVISIVSESYPHLEKGCIRDFKNILFSTGFWDSVNYNKNEHVCNLSNGSIVEFFSADKPDKLRGSRRDILFINEANNVDWESYLQLSIRTRHFVYLDFNPTSKFWAHKELKNDPDTDWITLTYKDNEAIDKSVLKELMKAKEKAKTSSYWANWWKVYGLGEVGSLQGVVFENWKTINSIPEEAKYLGTGLDFGFTNDPTAAVDIYRYNGMLLIDEVTYQTGLHNNDIAKRLKGKKVYADAAEPKSISEIRRHGVQIMAAKKGKDSITYGIDLLQQHELLVTEKSVNVIKELRAYTWDKDREGNRVNKPIDAYNHSIDAIRYCAVMTLQRGKGEYHIR